MGKIVVFGAGGRAGRRTVAEARTRGHQVTAVVRDPAKHADLAAAGVDLVAGDVLDADGVAALAAGHDAAVNTTYQPDAAPAEFFADAARALLSGLARAGVGRLVLIGIGTCLEAEPGVPLHDTPGFPAEARAFSLGHQAELDVLRAEGDTIDWLVLAPPPVFLDADAERTGNYRIGGMAILPPADGSAPDTQTFSYADLAVAALDEIDSAKHHRTMAAIA